MDKKKKINIVVIFPTVITVIIMCGLLYFVLQSASTTAASMDKPDTIHDAYQRVEATIHEEYP